ncbi:MAG: hypothetical protein M1829_001372 [Trizodia sp. TS-e1964]|nr:MAG: hypothetical protein M1829_001372 [Trizodia sp. TS-e1964]
MEPSSAFRRQQTHPPLPSPTLPVLGNIQSNARHNTTPPRSPTAASSRRITKAVAASRARNLRLASPEHIRDSRYTSAENRPAADVEALGRHSHDLSVTPGGTHESLVNSMLLSLENITTPHTLNSPCLSVHHLASTHDEEQLYSAFDDDGTYPPPALHPAQSQRSRGLTYATSLSSDTSLGGDDPQLHRRHRDSSASNYYSALGRIDSIGGYSSRPESSRGRVFESQRALTSATKTFNIQKPATSVRSSRSGSLDMGSQRGVLATADRWSPRLEHRSSSFDQCYGHRIIHSSHASMSANTRADMPGGISVPLPYNRQDAAPTPTVPAGPRRPQSPPLTTVYPPSLPLRSPTHIDTLSRYSSFRKNSIASSGPRSQTHRPDRAGDIPRSNSAATVTAPIATAPRQGRATVHGTPHSSPPQKEKHGFFRRMFGSSRHPEPVLQDPLPLHLPRAESASSWRKEGKIQHITQQLKTPVEPSFPVKDISQTLSKKPSSFFRRRKKSISMEESPALPLQLHLVRGEVVLKDPLPSPMSSLRKVMNPYLRRPETPMSTFQQLDDQDSVEVLGCRDRSTSLLRYGSKGERWIASESAPVTRNGPLASSTKDNKPENSHFSNLRDSASPTSAQIHGRSDEDKTLLDRKMSYPGGRPMTSPNTTALAEFRMPNRSQSYGVSSPLSLSPVTDKQIEPLPQESTTSLVIEDPGASSTYMEERGTPQPAQDFVSAERLDLDHLTVRKLSIPTDHPKRLVIRTSASTTSDYRTALSTPVVQTHEGSDAKEAESLANHSPDLGSLVDYLIRPEVVIVSDVTEPNTDDREKAKKIYDGDEGFVQKSRAAAWLGDVTPAAGRVRRAYMELYAWPNLSILAAIRSLCNRLVLKAETQQVDRLLDAFAKRWCQCNPNHGFKSIDVVHTICYSILLLNTDLHLADIETKMTRSQFVKNTMPPILRAAATADAAAVEASSIARPGGVDTGSPAASSPVADGKESRTSLDAEPRPTRRLSSMIGPFSGQEARGSSNYSDHDSPLDSCGPLVKAPCIGPPKSWEIQVEVVLKDIFISIRQLRLPLHGVSSERVSEPAQAPSNGLVASVMRRTPSTISKAPSEAISHRGRQDNGRPLTGRWSSKNRSRARVYPISTVGSSRTSFDDQSSIWSPAASSTWSKYSLGKTHTSMSVDSLGSNFPRGDYQQSIGFANALSQAIIREESAAGIPVMEETRGSVPLLEDESLELSGAPWAKEGILKHKHHLEALDKRAKDRNWNECFAVIEKGHMRLFSFNMKSSIRSRHKKQPSGGVVGGGNWSENAEDLGSFPLRQTIASALPPPGYSKARPHVWALSLPTGAVHLFHVNTPEIVKEFVSTANYWSARLSKEPLVGGISNIEYGWSTALLSNALSMRNSRPESSPALAAYGAGTRSSLQSSIRSSIEHSGGTSVSSMRARLPGDRINISDWTPPQQSFMASQLNETDQLKALLTYVKNIEHELQKHNEQRGLLLLAFTPRHPNSSKALSNWERKSSYLLREIVKFGTYIDCLNSAQIQKEKLYASRKEDHQAQRKEPLAVVTVNDISHEV